jgi:peptidoglycan/xylan/chitin deacetylase (PgdA/CDA1 family)
VRTAHSTDAARRRAVIRRRRTVRRRRGLAGLILVAIAALAGWAALGGHGGRGTAAASSPGASPAVAAASGSGSVQNGAVAPAQPVKLPPIPPAHPGTAHVVSAGPSSRKAVALTFDDGYCDACIGGLVRGVQRTGAHVTFCPNGTYGSAWAHHAAAIRRLIAAGQVAICNHTFSHADLRGLDAAAIDREIDRNEAWIEKTFGVTARPYLRPPYGAYTSTVLAEAGKRGFTRLLMWSGTLADSSQRTPDYVVAAIKKWARPGVIILGHGNYPATGEAFARIIAALDAMGLRTLTVPELLRGT